MFTKTEYKKRFNKKFYEFVEKEFPQYDLNFEEGEGTVYLIPKHKIQKGMNSIMYHQSEHYCLSYNNCDIGVKQDEEKMNEYIKLINEKVLQDWHIEADKEFLIRNNK